MRGLLFGFRKRLPAPRPASQEAPAAGISTLQFEVTNNCNLACSICWRALRGQGPVVRDLTLEKFKVCLDKMLSAFPIREVNTQGLGEPVLCPDILEILSYIKSKSLTVWFVTNGTLIDEPLAKRMVEIGVDKIRVSVDSADTGVYAAIKRGGSLEKVIENIGVLNRYKTALQSDAPAISFNSVVLKKNLSLLDGLVALARRLGVRELTLIPLVDFSKGLAVAEEQVDFYADSFKAGFARFQREAAAGGVEANLGISLESKEARFCDFGLYVDAGCFVHPCCNISRFTFGNIYAADVRAIAAKHLEFRKWLKKKEMSCKECNRILDSR